MQLKHLCLSALLILGGIGCQLPDSLPRKSRFSSPPTQLLTEHAGEGPVWHPELGLLFSGHGDITRYLGEGETTVHLEDAGSNGLLIDGQERLLVCQPVRRRVSRIEADGSLTVLTDQYEGQAYNQPNDITVDTQGRIYFSDPRYGSREGMQIRDDDGRLVEGVYRIDPDGSVTRVITHEVDRPNGVFVTADDRFLFVADNNNNEVGGARKLYRFDLLADGTVDVASQKLIFDWQSSRGPDGMAADQDGYLYVAGGRSEARLPAETASPYVGGIYVFSPTGEFVQFVPIPNDEVTNCAFGGEDRRDLYITAGGTLWTIRTRTPGALRW